MARIFLTLFSVIISSTSFSQNVTGAWGGVLKVQGMQLRLVFNITKSGSTYTSTLDSPDQGAKGIPVSSTSFENSTLKIAVAAAGIQYEGTLAPDSTITGTFKQAGQSFPLNLTKQKAEVKTLRPQEPVKPYPYYEEDVTFENKTASITLAGTLTLPKKDGVFPVVILISGSGAQNRNEELMGHKPFLVLSDYLTRNGIAVLRFDDRGVGKSTGNFQTATSADFATDVTAAVEYLKTRTEINKKKIGLIGHSEGGVIAPMVAANSKDIAFIVLMAGTGVPGDQLFLAQEKLVGRASGLDSVALSINERLSRQAYEIVKKTTNDEALKAELTALLKRNNVSDDEISRSLGRTLNPWTLYFIRHDPAPALTKVKCPVLALNGSNDLQVPKENLMAIKNALTKGGNKNVTTKELAGLNHLFQESKTGSPTEYGTIEQTISPAALTEIVSWLKLQVK
ncbi:MAG TPA: alpha/beta hydrolase [Cyclobacteriaceae bacterium]|nr:alpha/beta fold hydrolase [Cyclobacteriaceae bacterium]HMV08464.1 alpha/beta hydrolase [Cyclobacteriaceae bacterium]HMV89175.1 alpha/beta hydrolase [Cyclobacteriaceae bacterium]HMX01237.1 alpha/beta hydrolase [Cyclobacteriaceae bacterium]HMX50640.1 alpha/beta hydrolase [Cyclobacteriaceae bacterium]